VLHCHAEEARVAAHAQALFDPQRQVSFGIGGAHLVGDRAGDRRYVDHFVLKLGLRHVAQLQHCVEEVIHPAHRVAELAKIADRKLGQLVPMILPQRLTVAVDDAEGCAHVMPDRVRELRELGSRVRLRRESRGLLAVVGHDSARVRRSMIGTI